MQIARHVNSTILKLQHRESCEMKYGKCYWEKYRERKKDRIDTFVNFLLFFIYMLVLNFEVIENINNFNHFKHN